MQYQNRIVSHPGINSPTVHIVQDDHQSLQNTQASSPSAVSWHSDDEDLSPRASKYYSDLFALYTQRSPTNVAPTGDCHAESHTFNVRTASTITVFPSFVAHGTKLKDTGIAQQQVDLCKSTSVQGRSFLKDRYQRAKDIYQTGPPGEAQMFWEGIKSYLKEKERGRGTAFEMCSPKQTSAHSQKPPPESISRKHPFMAHGTTEGTQKLKARHDSAVSYGDISRTSREVPIRLRQTVLTVDTNKPLPPSPPLSIAPKKRPQKDKGKVLDVNKPLPRTPFPCSPDTLKPSREPVDDYPADSPWLVAHTQAVGHEAPVWQPKALEQGHRERLTHDQPGPQQIAGFKNLARKPSKAHMRDNGKSKPSRQEQAHAALKAKISRPIPIPPAVNFSPTLLTPRPHEISEKAKGKQKVPASPTWLDRLVHPSLPAMPDMPVTYRNRRPDSDESFACQGLRERAGCEMYVGDGEVSVRERGPRMRGDEESEEREKGLRPQPLFTRRMGKSRARNVSDERADQKRTGWWI